MNTGRAAALPQPGYTEPQRLVITSTEVRVEAFPEDGSAPRDIDLSALPVARSMQEWLASAVAAATGPSGTLRTRASHHNVKSMLMRFTRHLASFSWPPQRPDQLRRAHIDGFILAGGRALHRDLGGLRSLLRQAQPPPPDEFWARLSTASTPKISGRLSSYSEAEFRRIMSRCKRELRAAATRIRHANEHLAAWRDEHISLADRDTWEYGFLLDHLDRHGDIPRSANGTPHRSVHRHGGTEALTAALYLTYDEMVAATVLLICLTGQNLSTLEAATIEHLRPDGHTEGTASALVDLVKPRRGSRSAHMSVVWSQTAPDGSRSSDQLDTPFGVFTLLTELGNAGRTRLGTNRLLVFYTHRGGPRGRGLRAGLPHSAIWLWSRTGANLLCDPVPGADEPAAPLHLDARRLRLTFLELYQRPVAQTERTLANQYLARNRGNIAEYQRLVATVLDQQVAAARAIRPMPVLTTTDMVKAETDPAAHGLATETVADLVAGRLDTVLAGCIDNRNGPHNAAGQPCTASFLLCLSCPCARATPAHLPTQVLVHDELHARRSRMTPLDWAQRYGTAATQLADLLNQHGPGAVDDARAGATEAQHDLVTRFLRRELDWS
jgi:hypothetical protein